MQRMLAAGEIRGITSEQIDKLKRTRDIPRRAQIWDAHSKSWQTLRSRTAHMRYVGEDAVDYWNRRGKYFGRLSPEVRAWMLDPDNYRIELGTGGTGNCVRGAKNKSQYDTNQGGVAPQKSIGPSPKSDYF